MRRTRTDRGARRREAPSVSAAELLPIEALTEDGLLVRSDGAFVRYLDVVPGNPLVLDAHGCDRMTRGFTALLSRVPAGMSVQLYAQATPVALGDVLARTRAETDAATAELIASTDLQLRAQGLALRRLAACHEESLRVHAEDQAAVEVRYVLAASYLPDLAAQPVGTLRRPRARSRQYTLARTPATHARLARESWQLLESLCAALTGLDTTATVLTGPQVAELIWRRTAPALAAAGTPPPEKGLCAPLDAPTSPERAALRSLLLRSALAPCVVDFSQRRYVEVDGGLEQTIFLAGRPERTFYGWLLHSMQHPRPWALSVHVHPRDRAGERDRHHRKASRLWGVNEGALDQRRRPDRTQYEQQAELEELVDELSTGAETLCDVSVYQTLREPGPDPDPVALQETVAGALRDLATPVDARALPGDFAQRDLWLSNLPLGLDAARKTVPLITRNAADSVPFVSTSCGSPDGLPLGFAEPGRTLERLHPFDRLHDNGTTLIFAKSGGGKTMTTIALASAALPRGCQVNVIDRSAGHYAFLCDLIPGAAHLELGDEDAATINPWDVPDPAAVPRSKVAFLVRLHALLIGDHDISEDAYGLGPLERNLLALAIRTVYARAAQGEGTPCESFLQQVLRDLAAREARDPDGSEENAGVLRNLAQRLAEFCADGTYGYLFDRPTTIAADDAPLVVFNTRNVPDDVAAPLLFCVLELVSRRVQTRYERHQQRLAEGRPAAGPFDGSSAVVVEELWKLVERRATGAWVNELVKRARHIGLWFIAITQQRGDLAGPQGRALLDNSTLQLFLRNGPDDVAHVAQALRLGPEEVDQISRLVTEKRSHAQAYVINGQRGKGTVAIRLGSSIYWTATSDPVNDLPWRQLALEHAGFHTAQDPIGRAAAAFQALELLADPAFYA